MKDVRTTPENVGVSIFFGVFFQKVLAGQAHLWYNIHMEKKPSNIINITSMKRSELETFAMQKSLENEELAAKLAWYEEQFRISRSKRFGRSSEQTYEGQLSVFNEAESENSAGPVSEPKVEEVLTAKRKKQKGRKASVTDELPKNVIEYRLTPEETICPACGGDMHEMTKNVRNELTVIPARVSVTEHVQYVYACRNCDKNGINTPIIAAKAPSGVLRNSLASPSFLAYVMNCKYVLALPLYRQAQEFKRTGIDIGRQTLANWMIRASRVYLKPLYDMLHGELVKREVLFADETTLEVLREPGREASADSYMWLYRTGGDTDKPIVLYEYQQGRSGDFPKAFLAGFSGYLHVDGYAGYHKLLRGDGAGSPNGQGVTLVGCWSHARRPYDEAKRAMPRGADLAGTLTEKGLAYCNLLFKIEEDLKDLSPEERKARRLEESLPMAEEYFAWVKSAAKIAAPQMKIGRAVNYSINQEKHLRAFLLDGRLELSNNRSERSIKPFVIGRKNWLFSDTPGGAEASAVIYSIVETAKENGLSVIPYLTHLFETLSNADKTDRAVLSALLPWSKSLPPECKTPTASSTSRANAGGT
jgi:transposase